MSTAASNILILQYKMRHNITFEALNDLLVLLKLHCPSPNNCLSSAYLLKKEFSGLKCPAGCFTASTASHTQCPNTDCLRDFRGDSSRSSFMQVPIEGHY